jgi:hypothetical protein
VLDRRSRRIGLGAAAVVVTAVGVAVPATVGHATRAIPTLRMLTGAHHIEADRFGASWDLYLPQTVYLSAVNGSFEIDAARRHGKVTLEQVVRDGRKITKLRKITTPTEASFDTGLPKFFSIVISDSQGHVVATARPDFCPTADYSAQRVSPKGPDNPTFPSYCGDKLTKATVWGVDEGWAVPEYVDIKASPTDVPDGKYTMTIGIAPSYAKQLKINASDSKTTVALNVVTQDDGCSKICPGGLRHHSRVARPAGASHAGRRPVGGGYPSTPTGGGLPDLAALPAHGLSTSHDVKHNQDYLNFGATIWNAGPGAFDVEGFRHNGKPTMQARQYIYRNGHSVRSMKIGTFEFDNRKGHHHWHLEDVAQYDLLNSKGKRVVLSGKQSFCLAPTDPLDLTVPGALWNPDSIGLSSNCPTDQSLWLRETLPVGWGDTYVQEKGGQAFNITDLPNGRYQIRISTNPRGRIHEVTRKNNTALLAVNIGGVPGARTVTRLGPVNPH